MLAWLRKIRIIIPVKYFFITALAMFPKFWSINMLRAYRIFGQCAVLVSMTSKDETYSGKSFMSVLARLNIFFNMLIRPKILKKNQKNFIRMIFYSQQNDNNNHIHSVLDKLRPLTHLFGTIKTADRLLYKLWNKHSFWKKNIFF